MYSKHKMFLKAIELGSFQRLIVWLLMLKIFQKGGVEDS